jgi:hypothetical protein
MPAVVEYPTVIQEALERFGPLFANEPQEYHFADYLTGLIVAERKNVSAITRELAFTTDQSCLNRWLTQVVWEEQCVNRERLDWLQKDPATRYHAQGVIPIDNVLIDHEGKLIEDVGYFWDHADKRHLIAHDYLIVNYVCSSGAHYPLEFRRFIKKEDAIARSIPFRDHNVLLRELVDWVIQEQIPGDFTFDSYFTNAANLNHIHHCQRGYVGDLKFNRKILYRGQEIKAEELAAQIPQSARKAVIIEDSEGHEKVHSGANREHSGTRIKGSGKAGEDKRKVQWHFTKTVSISGVDHPVRIVILWKERESKKASKILITDRTYWEISRILRVYRRRWSGTECFHRDGKQHLGMGDCQLRNGKGQTRHLYLVFLVHTILLRQMSQGCKKSERGRKGNREGNNDRPRSSGWTLERLTTIGQARMAVLRETLGQTISWAIDRFTQDQWSLQQIKAQLALS